MGFNFKRALLGGAVLAGLGVGAAQAEDVVPTVDTFTLTALRQQRLVYDVPGTVSVITAEEIEKTLVTDIKDLVRYEPGVSVPQGPARFGAALGTTGRDGNAGFTIRGLGGNRVLIQVDGIRSPDGFTFGAQSAGRGDYVDVDMLQRVEILRGPGSALYGSDGVAGVVSFITKDPEDFLGAGETFGGRVRASHATADASLAGNLILAGRQGAWSGMISYTGREASELDNKGDVATEDFTRTRPNPQDSRSDAALARIVFAPSQAHRFRLTGEVNEVDIDYEVLSGRLAPLFGQPPGSPPGPSTVIDLDARDSIERSRVSLDYRYQGAGLVDSALLALYFQDSKSTQFSEEDRLSSPDRTRLNTFDNRVWGVSGQGVSNFGAGGAVTHDVVYGFDYSKTRQEGLRDGTVAPIGEPFPTRAFPNTDYELTGLFIQDDIGLMGGALRIVPALRYDAYDLDAMPDPVLPGPAADQSDEHLSAKLGVVYWANDNIGGFANYAEGFKAPSPSQVNNFFSNPIFGYTSLPNPDLRPETSDSFEVGLRMRGMDGAGARWSGQLVWFDSQFEDFIDQVVVGGTGAPGNPLLFQYVNLTDVEISGAEARLEGGWGNGFSLNFAASTARGATTTGGTTTPLNSIDPWKAVIGAGYADPDGRFGGQVIVTRVGDKEAGRIDQSACTGGCFATGAFTLLDATAYWNITDQATLRIGAFNLTDEKYWEWSDVAGVSAGTATLDAYTRPGRNFSVSLGYRFP